MKALNDVLAKMLDGDDSECIPTGFVGLDKLLEGGLKLGGVTIVAGRPMMGKTSFLLDVSIHYTQTVGKKVAFFSTEDAEESVALRVLGKSSKRAKEYFNVYSARDLKQKRFEDGDDFQSSYNEIKNLPILIHWNPSITPFEIKDICEGIRELGMIIVDSSIRCDTDRSASEYLFNLSQIALKLHVPIICSCSVNKCAEYQDDYRPDLYSILGVGLRFGAPEPTVIALYRESYYSGNNEEKSYCYPAEAIVFPFLRSGKGGGTAHLVWNERSCSFENTCDNEPKHNNKEVEKASCCKHWVVFSDYELISIAQQQSKEDQYKNVIHISKDNFDEAKECFIRQMMKFDHDGVLKDIWASMDDWEFKQRVITLDTIFDKWMLDLNAEIEEQGYRASGYAYLGKTASMWETFNYKYFNSKFHNVISKNCFDMENPNDRYFFEVMREDERTGEIKPYFYMELLPSK